jgi:hypothetical protein
MCIDSNCSQSSLEESGISIPLEDEIKARRILCRIIRQLMKRGLGIHDVLYPELSAA